MDRDLLLGRLAAVLQRRLRHLSLIALRSLIERFDHVSDPALRGRAFRREIGKFPAAVVVEMLDALGGDAGRRRPAAQKLFLDFLDEASVREAFSPELLDEIWRIGRNRGYHRLLGSFFYTSGADKRLDDRPALPPDIRDIPLGRRKYLARLGIIDTLERLINDNDVGVIGNLLNNPRLTEREVVKLAARRPNSPEILSAIASKRRWLSRYAVKKALIYNPQTPISITLPLLRYLLRRDLAELSRSGSVSALVRRAAADALAGWEER